MEMINENVEQIKQFINILNNDVSYQNVTKWTFKGLSLQVNCFISFRSGLNNFVEGNYFIFMKFLIFQRKYQ